MILTALWAQRHLANGEGEMWSLGLDQTSAAASACGWMKVAIVVTETLPRNGSRSVHGKASSRRQSRRPRALYKYGGFGFSCEPSRPVMQQEKSQWALEKNRLSMTTDSGNGFGCIKVQAKEEGPLQRLPTTKAGVYA